MWRIGTHSDLGGTWLSDYVENKLGGFGLTGTKKPDCPLIGQNGNIFNLMGIAARTLRQNGLAEQSKEMSDTFCVESKEVQHISIGHTKAQDKDS